MQARVQGQSSGSQQSSAGQRVRHATPDRDTESLRRLVRHRLRQRALPKDVREEGLDGIKMVVGDGNEMM